MINKQFLIIASSFMLSALITANPELFSETKTIKSIIDTLVAKSPNKVFNTQNLIEVEKTQSKNANNIHTQYSFYIDLSIKTNDKQLLKLIKTAKTYCQTTTTLTHKQKMNGFNMDIKKDENNALIGLIIINQPSCIAQPKVTLKRPYSATTDKNSLIKQPTKYQKI